MGAIQTHRGVLPVPLIPIETVLRRSRYALSVDKKNMFLWDSYPSRTHSNREWSQGVQPLVPGFCIALIIPGVTLIESADSRPLSMVWCSL